MNLDLLEEDECEKDGRREEEGRKIGRKKDKV